MFYTILTNIYISAEMFNQATWQRVWAAKSVKDMRRGFAGGSFLVFLLMMFFGIMGMIAYANDPEAYDNYEKYACKNLNQLVVADMFILRLWPTSVSLC